MDKPPNKLEERLSDAREKLGDTLGSITDKADVHALKSSVAERLPDTETVRAGMTNPTVRSIGLLALGVIAGLAVPLSAIERRTLAPLGSEVVRRAVDARDDVIDQSKAVLNETVAAARDSVERHGQDIAANLGATTKTPGSGSKN